MFDLQTLVKKQLREQHTHITYLWPLPFAKRALMIVTVRLSRNVCIVEPAA